MSESPSFATRKTRFLNRWHAFRAARARVSATGFATSPEPRSIGDFSRGRALLSGEFLFAGHLLHAPDTDIWALDAPSPAYRRALHGFAWLDDLAAVGDRTAQARAQDWVFAWIKRYGAGRGAGWRAELAGRRVLRWINHGELLLREAEAPQKAAFFRSLGQQAVFLSRRWHGAGPGLPRFEALTGLVTAAISVEGLGHHLPAAQKALESACAEQIDAGGGLPSRNPEELLSVFALLCWTAAAMSDAGQAAGPAQQQAIKRIAPTLRSLRHADGGLARFHGGGHGIDGRLDQALAFSRVRGRHSDTLAMGYARLSAGRTSVIIDASPPPPGRDSRNAHASALAFEMTSGRRPVIVSCGSGLNFGVEWRRAGRATPSHSTLSLEGYSSARLGPKETGSGLEPLVDGPAHMPVELGQIIDGLQFQGGHDGYVATHGLTHARTLEITFDGRAMTGEDMLLALSDDEKKRLAQVLDATGTQGLAYDIRFHLHPDVEARWKSEDQRIDLLLKSGEVWQFRHDGSQEMSLEASVYLEAARPEPRPTNQIVLSGRAMSYATRVRWSLSKAEETAIGLRDLTRDPIDLTS